LHKRYLILGATKLKLVWIPSNP